jgi:hypothetical protein
VEEESKLTLKQIVWQQEALEYAPKEVRFSETVQLSLTQHW